MRAEMGWNYDAAGRATGLNKETWRLWEKGKRHCTDIETASRLISGATGFSYEWLMLGGALTPPMPPSDTRPTNPCLSDRNAKILMWNSQAFRRALTAA